MLHLLQRLFRSQPAWVHQALKDRSPVDSGWGWTLPERFQA